MCNVFVFLLTFFRGSRLSIRGCSVLLPPAQSHVVGSNLLGCQDADLQPPFSLKVTQILGTPCYSTFLMGKITLFRILS